MVENKLDSLALVVNTYFEYNENEEDFMKYMKTKWEKESDKQRANSKDTK